MAAITVCSDFDLVGLNLGPELLTFYQVLRCCWKPYPGGRKEPERRPPPSPLPTSMHQELWFLRHLVVRTPLAAPSKRFGNLPAAAAAAKSLQSCPTLCDPMNRSMPGLPVHHHLPEFTQTHVHRVGDAIQPSHPRSSPSHPAPNPSQNQSLFQ